MNITSQNTQEQTAEDLAGFATLQFFGGSDEVVSFAIPQPPAGIAGGPRDGAGSVGD